MKNASCNVPTTNNYTSRFVRDFFDTFEVPKTTVPFNVYEDKEHFIFETEVPGLNENEIIVEYDKDTLKVSGEKKIELKEEDVTFYRREISAGKFNRSFTLHTPVKHEEMKAQLKNGVLKITLPKAESVKAKQIQITTSP